MDRLSQLHQESGEVGVISLSGHLPVSLYMLIPEISKIHCHPSRGIKVK
jgi:hypothetical protein